ncbi:MAG: prenyltransferase/squalene oxidase repeat-containing protein [Halobacteriota archaeon]|nr:prenyltransferase/squalene oxidase repeat-containing protein [Halobacteriota archaeon]
MVKKVATIVSIILLLSTLAIPAMAYPYNVGDEEIDDALDYLRGEQETDGNIGGFATSAWVIMAIAAAGEDPNDWDAGGDSIVDYLRDNSDQLDDDEATDWERQLLAIVACGEDPRDFGGIDYVEKVEEFHDGDQIDEPTLLNDDSWGIISLISAGVSEDDEIINDSVTFIKDNQNGDGGWRFDVGGESTVDDTAAVIMALIAAGEDPGSEVISDALDYLSSMQDNDGGFPEYAGGETNTASDAFAIGAIVACGEDPTDWEKSGNDPVGHLIGLKQPDGSFNWTEETSSRPEWMTSLALVTLLGQSYPVKIYEGGEEAWTGQVRIEGKDETIWSGEVTFDKSTIIADNSGNVYEIDYPSALGALDEAAESGGFDYYVTDEYGFLYIESVSGEESSGMYGWLYRVDYISPMVGASDFELDDANKEVLWSYGVWGESPLRISSEKTRVNASEEFTIIVEYYNDTESDWYALEGATVYADSNEYLTDEDGEAMASIVLPRRYELWAEKEGYVRSDKIEVEVIGEGSTAQVSLYARIIPSISISLSPSSLDFGELAPGETSGEQEITIENNGALQIEVTANVTDDANDLFVDGLELDREIWSSFTTEIEGGESDVTDARLNVPEDYIGVGGAGTLTFWAELA